MSSNHPIKITVEIADLPAECHLTGEQAAAELQRFQRLKARIELSETCVDLGRELVAKMAEEEGFYAYIGGHHVALHVLQDGDIIEPRLALLTSTSEDWL